MICTVKLFAAARQLAGAEEVTVELADKATVSDLRATLAKEFPSLAELLPSAMMAIDTQYANDQVVISPGSEIAVIPPVSGG